MVTWEQLAQMRTFNEATCGLLYAVRYACEPRPQEDPRFPLTQVIPYYGVPVDRAVWQAKHVMREARRLGLYPATAQLEAETRAAA